VAAAVPTKAVKARTNSKVAHVRRQMLKRGLAGGVVEKKRAEI
jgi:hypothetical protein